jgi:hypothetical protein
MIAKTYSPENDFDLYEKYETLTNKLKEVKYHTISSSSVLQLIALILNKKDCGRKTILRIEKQEFIDIWDAVESAILSAVDFFRGYGIPVSKLLPFSGLIVTFGYYFFKHPKNPSGFQLKMLEDFFWRVSVGNRYSASVDSKITIDINKIDKILNNELPKYEWVIDTSEEFIRVNGVFSTGRAMIKSVLCLFTIQKPKLFHNNLIVNVDNSTLKNANARNYHHFFPKHYMKKNHPSWSYEEVNHIANITIVDDDLNKNKIRTKSPSDYMSNFRIENPKLNETMQSHLISDLEVFGIWDNDYGKFFNQRIKLISELLTEKIIQN